MIRLRSLGECVIEVGETRIGPQQEILFAVLLFILLKPNHKCERSELLDLLWSDRSHDKARHCLRQVIYNIRKRGVRVAVTGEEIALSDEKVHIDCSFSTLPSPTALKDASALAITVTGPFLPGYAPRLTSEFATWLEHTREYVHVVATGILASAIRVHRERADWLHAIQLAQTCLELDPLNEEATLAIAEGSALSGNKVRAMAVLERFSQEVGRNASDLTSSARALRRRIASLDRPNATRSPHWTPSLQGRDRELQWLRRHLLEASERDLVFVTGEEGIGKTRLANEVRATAQIMGFFTCSHAVAEIDERRPFALLTDLVPALLSAPGAIGASPSSLDVLKGIQSDSQAHDIPHPEHTHARLIRAFVDLVAAICSEQPVLIVIDDAHWLDQQSWQVVRRLHSLAARQPLLTLIAARPQAKESDALYSAALLARRLCLAPLDADAARRIVANLYNEDSSTLSDTVRERSIALSGGNPLYLIELARGALEDPSATIPHSLRELVSRRLARLSRPAITILQVVGLLDAHASLPRLASTLDLDRSRFTEALHELEVEGLLSWDSHVVRQQHRVVGDVALGMLGPLQRAEYHHRVAQVLDQTATIGGSTSILWAAAQHWKHAGESPRAVALLRKCATRLARLGSPEQAAELLELALSYSTGERQRSGIIPALVECLTSAGRWRRAAGFASTHDPRIDGAGAKTHSRFELLQFDIAWRNGQSLQTILSKVSECSRSPLATPAHRVCATSFGLICANNMLDAASADRLYEGARNALMSSEVPEIERLYCSMIYGTSFGDLDEAVSCARAIRQTLLETGDAYRQVVMLRHCAATLRAAGFVDEAVDELTLAHELALTNGLGTAVRAVSFSLESLFLAAGDFAGAEVWSNSASGHVTCDEDRVTSANHFTARAQLALLRREHREAALLLARADEQLAHSGSCRARMVSLALGVRIRHASGDLVSSESELSELLEWHHRARNLGGHDIVMEALLGTWQLLGSDAGRKYFADYVARFRRERDPISYSLRRMAEQYLGGSSPAVMIHEQGTYARE